MTAFQPQSNANPSGPNAEGEKLSGTLERITYFNEENHYTVARLTVEGEPQPLTVVGNLVGANVGDTLELVGEWKAHQRFGRQFEVTHFRAVMPTTVKGLENKIIPIGSGKHEQAMIAAIIKSGYDGPIGILGHKADEDVAVSLRNNLEGLEKVLDELHAK